MGKASRARFSLDECKRKGAVIGGTKTKDEEVDARKRRLLRPQDGPMIRRLFFRSETSAFFIHQTASECWQFGHIANVYTTKDG